MDEAGDIGTACDLHSEILQQQHCGDDHGEDREIVEMQLTVQSERLDHEGLSSTHFHRPSSISNMAAIL